MKAYRQPHTKSWYVHLADKVVENKDVKVLSDFNIQVDKFIEVRRPDIILVRKKKEGSTIVDIAVPGDIRTQMKKDKKIEKCEDLRQEISNL